MIKLIVGNKGTGKTKTIIEMANKAIADEKNHVVVIEKSDKLKYDISHKARLVGASEYDINGFEMFSGFLAGLAAGNYDITHIFIDSVNKITGEVSSDGIEQFVKTLEKLDAHTNITFVIAVSVAVEQLGQTAKKYL